MKIVTFNDSLMDLFDQKIIQTLGCETDFKVETSPELRLYKLPGKSSQFCLSVCPVRPAHDHHDHHDHRDHNDHHDRHDRHDRRDHDDHDDHGDHEKNRGCTQGSWWLYTTMHNVHFG